jgi:RNA-binding protein YhbY
VVSVKTITKELGITEKTVEKLAESLDRHHLIKLEYTFFKGAQLVRLKHEKS